MPDNYSPAIDSGTTFQALPAPSIIVAPPVDLIGNPRPTAWLPALDIVDMGAYESPLKIGGDSNRERSSFQSERQPLSPTETSNPSSPGATKSGQNDARSAAASAAD